VTYVTTVVPWESIISVSGLAAWSAAGPPLLREVGPRYGPSWPPDQRECRQAGEEKRGYTAQPSPRYGPPRLRHAGRGKRGYAIQ
jgi:hypothetical protein